MRENLKNISRIGEWTNSVDDINRNFTILNDIINEFDFRSERCKGLFPSVSRLYELFPNPGEGTWALVGEEFPGVIYIFDDTNGEWISTGYTAGDETLDIKELYTNSVILDYPIENLFRPRATWIYKDNHGGNWRTYNNGIKLIDPDDVTYTVRLKSLLVGDDVELLEQTITDPYLWEFNVGQTEHFISATVKSNDNITKHFTTPYLSWTIDSTYYKRIINNKPYGRVPVEGDLFNINMHFADNEGKEKILSSTFCFIL